MFDKLMFYVYSITTAYHCLRGYGLSKIGSLKGAYQVVSETKLAKPILEAQSDMWSGMKEIAKDK